MKKPGIVVVALALVVIGLACLVFKENLGSNHWLAPYLGEISSALLVGGVLSILHKVFAQKEQDEELRKLFHIHKSVEEAGLDEVLAASQNYDFTKFLRNNRDVSIVINDGERWVGNYAIELRDRFSQPGTTTKLFTIDPDAPFLSILANKVGKTPEEQRTKIRNSWRSIRNEWNASAKAGTLDIYRLNFYPTQSVFLGSHEAVVTLYQTSTGRTNVPVFLVKDVGRDRSFFRFLQEDIKRLPSEATAVQLNAIA